MQSTDKNLLATIALHDWYKPMIVSRYIEVQGTTPNFCPKNLGILVSEMGQLQGVFGP